MLLPLPLRECNPGCRRRFTPTPVGQSTQNLPQFYHFTPTPVGKRAAVTGFGIQIAVTPTPVGKKTYGCLQVLRTL